MRCALRRACAFHAAGPCDKNGASAQRHMWPSPCSRSLTPIGQGVVTMLREVMGGRSARCAPRAHSRQMWGLTRAVAEWLLRPLPWTTFANVLGQQLAEFQRMTLHAVFGNKPRLQLWVRRQFHFAIPAPSQRIGPIAQLPRAAAASSNAPSCLGNDRQGPRTSKALLSLFFAQYGQQLGGPNRRPCGLAVGTIALDRSATLSGNTAQLAIRQRCAWHPANRWGATARFRLTPSWAFARSRRRPKPFDQALVKASRKDLTSDLGHSLGRKHV